MPSRVGVGRMAGQVKDGNPGPTLAIIASQVKEMEKRINDMLDKLEYMTHSIKTEDWAIAAEDAVYFHQELTALVSKFLREYTKYNPQGEKLYALIVDQHTSNCLLYRNVLSTLGMEIDEVSSGEDAITALDGRTTKYHLTVMNHHLPGISGTVTTRRLRQELGVKSCIIGIFVLQEDDDYNTPDSSEVINFKNAGLDYCLKKHNFFNFVVLMALGMCAHKEVCDHVSGEVQKIIDIINDFESTLGLKHEPAADPQSRSSENNIAVPANDGDSLSNDTS